MTGLKKSEKCLDNRLRFLYTTSELSVFFFIGAMNF